MLYKQRKIIFLLPPKTGTSSFLRWTKLYPNIRGRADKYRHYFLSDIVTYHNIKDLSEYKIYQLCRDPLDKLISSFYFEQAMPFYRKNFPKMDELGFNELMRLKLPLLKPLPQDKEIYSKKLIELTGDKRNVLLNSTVMFYQPQTNWNNLEADVTYIKLEDISKDNSILPEIFNVKVKDFPFINATHLRKRFAKPTLEMFEPSTLKLALETYKEDYKILDYEPPIKVLL
jgi:hypothetical protein